MEIFSTKAVLCSKGGHEILALLLAFTVQFVVMDLHTKLLSICESFERRHGKGCALRMHVSKIKLRVYRKSVWNFESKECLGVVRALVFSDTQCTIYYHVVVRCMDTA